MNSSSQNNVGITHRENLNLLLRSFQKYFTVLNKAYQRKMLMNFFWTSRNLNVRNDKGKQTCFAKAPRELCITRQVFNTNSYANVIILVNKFVAGLSSFGYDCYEIVGSLLNLEKKCNS